MSLLLRLTSGAPPASIVEEWAQDRSPPPSVAAGVHAPAVEEIPAAAIAAVVDEQPQPSAPADLAIRYSLAPAAVEDLAAPIDEPAAPAWLPRFAEHVVLAPVAVDDLPIAAVATIVDEPVIAIAAPRIAPDAHAANAAEDLAVVVAASLVDEDAPQVAAPALVAPRHIAHVAEDVPAHPAEEDARPLAPEPLAILGYAAAIAVEDAPSHPAEEDWRPLLCVVPPPQYATIAAVEDLAGIPVDEDPWSPPPPLLAVGGYWTPIVADELAALVAVLDEAQWTGGAPRLDLAGYERSAQADAEGLPIAVRGAEATAREEISALWSAGWTLARPDVPFTIEGEAYDAADSWARLSVVHATRNRVTIGEHPRDEIRGFVAVQLFAPVNQGIAALSTMADQARGVLEGVTGATVTTYAASTRYGQPDGRWATAIVVVPFRYYDVR